MRSLAAVLASVFSVSMVPQILSLLELIAGSIVDSHPYAPGVALIADAPVFHLGVPALMFVRASYFLQKEKDDSLTGALEMATTTLIGVMIYCLIRHAFHPHDSVLAAAGFVERGVVTNMVFLVALACFWIGRAFERPAVSFSALVLSGIALARIIWFDLLMHNPLWSHQLIGSMPIFNALLLPYGLPIAWIILINKELPYPSREGYLRYINSFLLLLAFVFVSFSVRQFYHGEYLDSVITTNAEIYTYSAVWLLMGILLLFFSTLCDNKAIRMASLAVMIISVGKVFLYDASELTGLYRVFSFLGLGLSLLGLSWFYTRFVFSRVSK